MLLYLLMSCCGLNCIALPCCIDDMDMSNINTTPMQDSVMKSAGMKSCEYLYEINKNRE